ncbi:SDR family NAD(P)-dependent oxidoreductase [Hyphobacterium marinum]|uniref:SDR family oxidoreductase n=1 Tax=Hyphobacterium marinum TaxID=3116574 RepID=A0ABU7LZA3_9PROT|nr:SDR family oxidoreductase [Hyphobacterium sp. Y6023]MEE2566612.1 SDR family oxidoreductase [Hyphobacterium sp. Y6023]
MSEFAGRRAVITGGGSGIGLAAAKRLAAGGASVVLMGRKLDRLEEAANGIDGALAVQCDVTDAGSVEAAFAKAREGGAINILVNNAGIASGRPFHKLDEAEWRRIQDVNVDGVFRCTKAVVGDLMSSDYGRVVNIASVAGLRGGPYISHYCASKHAVVGMTKALAVEWAQTKVTVNAVCPGYVETDMAEGAIQTIMSNTKRSRDEAVAELTKMNPQGRMIQVEEVAETVAWLCHPNSFTVNGQAIALDGGAP